MTGHDFKQLYGYEHHEREYLGRIPCGHPSVKSPDGSFHAIRFRTTQEGCTTYSRLGGAGCSSKCDACGHVETFGTEAGSYCRGCGRMVRMVR